MELKTRLELERLIQEYYADAEWGTLDFVDIEKSLASKLTDDDIGAILLCIDARISS